MAQHMRRNTLGLQRRALCSRRIHVLAQDILDAIASEGLATSVGEDGLSRLPSLNLSEIYLTMRDMLAVDVSSGLFCGIVKSGFNP